MRFKFLLLFVLYLLPFLNKGQEVIFKNSNHVVYYELQNDSLLFTIEDLNDFSLDFNFTPDSVFDDYVILQFDYNLNGAIDNSLNIDKYYSYNPTLSNNICSGYLLNGTNLSSCGSNSSGANASVKLSASNFNPSQHLVYSFNVPQNELFTSINVCSRMSLKIHRAGTATTAAFNLPSAGSNHYFVSPFMPVVLFNPVDLGADKIICPGDTIFYNSYLPHYLWNGTYTSNYVVPTSAGKYDLSIQDNTCLLSDTVLVGFQSKAYCNTSNISFPDIISPNGDGINDLFEPFPSEQLDTLHIDLCELKIYNRWGVQVSGSSGYPTWNGFLEWGKRAPQGTYFYTFTISGNKAYSRNGYFTMVY